MVLDLNRDETALLMCCVKLGLDVITRRPTDINVLLRLDRVPDETYETLAAKITELSPDLTEALLAVGGAAN